jgi:hypothetical protein
MAGQGFNDKAKARLQQRAEATLAAAGYQETVLVGLRAESGPSRWWVLLSTYITLFKKYYFVGLTDQNLVLIGLSIWTGRPSKIKSVTPRDQSSISEFNPGTMWGSLRLMTPDRNKPLKLRFAARMYREQAQSLVNALASGTMPAGGSY